MRFRTFLQTCWQLLHPVSYPWPAVNLQLPNSRIHLVGSIHMGTRPMSPLPDPLLKQLQAATALIVEADILNTPAVMPHSDDRPPLAQRLSAEQLAALRQRCVESDLSIELLDRLPAWQIALMLQSHQAMRLGLRPEYGIDYQLLQAARDLNKPVIELEGADTQMAMLTALPDDGQQLLDDSLEHWHTNARLLQTMISWWLEGPPQRGMPEGLLPSSFGQSLSDVLIRQRNEQWQQAFLRLPAGRYLAAVGALHLYAEHNLPSLFSR